MTFFTFRLFDVIIISAVSSVLFIGETKIMSIYLFFPTKRYEIETLAQNYFPYGLSPQSI